MKNKIISPIKSTEGKDLEDVETLIRFTNEGVRPVANNLIKGPSMKKHCVGDYACCGQRP